jgi:hypothetical protein
MPQGRRLCAWVIDDRLCRVVPVYLVQRGIYSVPMCGQHARRNGEIIERIGRSHRSFYGSNRPGRAGHGSKEQQDQWIRRSTTLAFMATATVSRTNEDGEFILPDEDTYDGRVIRIEPFNTFDFNDRTKAVVHARIVFEIGSGEFKGSTADAIYNPSLNEKAKLYGPFKAITGTVPSPGAAYDLEAELLNKPCRFVVEHRQGNQGGVFANVTTVLPPKKAKAPVVTDEELDARGA